MLLRMILIRMQRVAVATQRADLCAVIGQDLLELSQCCGILEHRGLAMSIAHVVARGQFDGINMERCEFLKDDRQRQLRQQRSEDPNAHNPVLS
jgi:hypothetical protein